MQQSWGFYGRAREIAEIRTILDRGRWFFCAISGRRRIGKTSLIREALQASGKPVIYVQIPDSDERGVIQAFQDALESSGHTEKSAHSVRTFQDVVTLIDLYCDLGVVIVLDEFQYFHRKSISSFQSLLQAEVDQLRDTSGGGLFVLGSIHTEMSAILEERNAPLFSRITDRLTLEHWDFETLFEMFAAHGIDDPHHQLFLWSLFEGVPKFYRDAFDQGVLIPHIDHRHRTLRRLFFEGSSPLRDEADNWFLREFRGRYDTVLRLLARLGPCSHGQLAEEFGRAGTETEKQLGGYLKILVDNYRMVERQLPIFAGRKDRKGRYAITDNFLMSWLGALAKNVSAARIMPLEKPLAAADEALAAVEGFTFERMVRQLTVECSRKGLGDFALTEMVQGYWNSADIEIDLVAIDETNRRIRFGACKRNADKHDTGAFEGHVGRFLDSREGRRFRDWTVEKALYSPAFTGSARTHLEASGYLCRDLDDFRHLLSPQKD
ncbi:ATP-binding protein [Magnetospirillum sp. UT-4]|uniref:ATP-binding protein n=1 Tax=Magnetospirillum sp. UT-4 TaxID=2681467 RepID=UPI0015739E79|nr:ATP-binding protein [Magnetospirillum sp. UT-4]